MTETRDKIVIESTTQGVDQSAEKLKGLANAYDGVAVASEKTEKSTVSIENKFASLERRFQTTAGQQAQYEKIQSQVNLAVKQNPELQDRANSVLAAAEARYLGAGTAVKALAEAHKGLDVQGQAAFHSIRSGIEQIAMGVPLTQALTGQINHLTFAASGEGGLAGAFGQVGGLIKNLISPTTAAIAATVALTAAAAALANQYDKVQVSSQRALIGAGERTGTTVSDLNQFTSQNSASFSGTSLSTKEARTLGEDLTKTGEIVISRLHDMSNAVVGFSNQTGQSMSEASKSMVGFASDPKKALTDLAKTFGDFDIETRKAVEELVRADDKTGAFNVILDALAEKSKKAAENMGVFEKAARSVGNVLASETVKPKGLEAGLAGANANVAAAQGALSDAERQGAPSPVLEALTENLAKARREAEQFQAAMDKVNTEKAAAQFKKLSTDADTAVKAIIPQIAQIDALKDKLAELDRAKAAGATSTQGAAVDNAATVAIQNQLAALKESQAQAARYNDQVAAISQSWGNVGQATALSLQALQNALPVAQAWTASAQMLAQQQATINNLINEGKTAEEAAALAAKQYELAKAAAVASAQKLVQSSQDQLDLIKAQGTGEEANVKSAIAYRDAIQAGATASQAAQISANVMAASLIQSANAANDMADAEERASRAARQLSEFNVTAMAHGTQYTSQGNASLGYILGQGYVSLDDYNAYYGASGSTQRATTQVGVSLASGDYASAYQAALQAGTITGNNVKNNIGQNFGVADPAAAITLLDQITEIANSGTSDKSIQNANFQKEIDLIKTLPGSVEGQKRIVELTNAINGLTTSTNSLNATNQDLLSPYYTMDPRTSHIGFRSQGMASGGYVDVPGSPSANDNMIATIPVASGERIYVDAMPGKRGGGSSQTFAITQNITIQGNASKDEVGRTLYQSGQALQRQLAASGR